MGRGGAFGPCPQRPITGGQYIPPKPKPAPWTRMGPYLRSTFYQVSGPRGTDRSPAGSIRALQNEPGNRGTNQGPWNGSGPRNTNQGPAGRIRTLNVGSGPRTSNQGLRDESGLRGTDQGPARRMRATQDEVWPRRMNQGPEKLIRTPRNK